MIQSQDLNITEMSIAAEKLPLPRRDVRKKSYRAAAAPLPRWFSKKFFKFHCHRCMGPEILILDDQIHSASGCFTCKH
jgi:hypothetical protein